MEVFDQANLPAFLVCWAKAIHNVPFSETQKRLLGPGIADAEAGHHGAEAEAYPGMPELGQFIISRLLACDFDVSTSNDLPELTGSRSSGAPHAFGFVYRQIFRGRPVPHVPLFINTFYPPNQPSMKRCLAFGRTIGRAVADWRGAGRIAVIGSGGLSHFVVDERLDRGFLAAIERKDFEAIGSMPECDLRAGTSELKNWAVTAAILDELGLSLGRYDYIPCYRSEAGTGNAMAFAEWH
jgi:OH-DDVA oxygenase/3-O-methylgallate 3,4-dioxygenase